MKKLFKIFLPAAISFIAATATLYADNQTQNPTQQSNAYLFTKYQGYPPVLVLDALNQDILPRNFRSTADISKVSSVVSTKGLADLNILGSAEFSAGNLKKVVATINAPIIVADLRQESHGVIDGDAVSWYGKHDWANKGKTPEEVEITQQALLNTIAKQHAVSFNKLLGKNPDGTLQLAPMSLKVDQVLSEEQLVKQNKLNYIRFYVTDGLRPSNMQVDRFVQFARSVPKNTWVYFHCRAGKGRTTTFMALYDMMHNAKQVSFEDILKRQKELGGLDLLKALKPTNYRYQAELDRITFIKRFYEYAKNNKDGFKTSWSEWNRNQVLPSKP